MTCIPPDFSFVLKHIGNILQYKYLICNEFINYQLDLIQFGRWGEREKQEIRETEPIRKELWKAPFPQPGKRSGYIWSHNLLKSTIQAPI